MRTSISNLLHLLPLFLHVMIICTWQSSTAFAWETKQPLQLEITTHLGDEQTFRQGDVVSFYVNLNTDAYLFIVYENAAGQLYLLLPNALFTDNFYKAGLFIPIPNQENPFQFRIEPPFGKETLWIFASDQNFPPVETTTTNGNLQAINKSLENIRNSLKQYTRKQNALFAESSLNVYTTPNPPKP